jgi:hypothetical protein
MEEADTETSWPRRLLSAPMVALILANLIPLVGLVAFDWDPWAVVAGYWAESAIVGAWYIVRIGTCRKAPWAAVLVVPFFTVHFGGFMFVHGIFLAVIRMFAISGHGGFDLTAATTAAGEGNDGFGAIVGILATMADGETETTLAWMLIPLALSHGVATLRDHFLSGRFREMSPPDAMMEPYGRIIVMHMAILIGIFAGFILGGFGTALMATFVVVKVVVDARALARIEERQAKAGGAAQRISTGPGRDGIEAP